MKLISNWQKAWKSYSVVFPFIATTIALLISIITSVLSSGLIDVNTSIYLGYALTALTWLGRVIQQIGLFVPIDKE